MKIAKLFIGAFVVFFNGPSVYLQATCSQVDCKAHNRFCADAGMAGVVGVRFYSNDSMTATTTAAFPDDNNPVLWAETDDGGSAIEYDFLYETQQPNCTQDCGAGELPCTGSGSGSTTDDDGDYKTECSGV